MHQNDELQKAFKKYFSSNGDSSEKLFHISFRGSGTDVLHFQDIYLNGEYFWGDAPDLLIKNDNQALIIEHFEFDCYKATKKGSQSRQEQRRIDRKFDQLIPTEEGSILLDSIRGEFSYSHYLSNVSRSFLSHYDKINIYKDNLRNSGKIDENTSIKVMFFIEDTSPIGSIVIDTDTPVTQPILLASSREFLALLSSHPEVDYVIACSQANSQKYIWFIDSRELSAYQDHVVDYANMQFLHFTPKVVSFKIALPPSQSELI